MIKNELKPLAISYGFERSKNLMTFISFGKEITIKNRINELKVILRLCNGINTEMEIADKAKKIIAISDTKAIISLLLSHNLIIDANSFYNVFHEVSKNPMLFHNNINDSQVSSLFNNARESKRYKDAKYIKALNKETDLTRIIRNRKSTRLFSKKETINFEELSGLSWATLGSFLNKSLVKSYTVPSGGSLYPTEQYFILLKNNEILKRGIYYWDKNLNKFLLIKPVPSEGRLNKVFESSLIKDSSVIQVITSRVKRMASKYSNRGYRYALLEAGHAAQNSCLFCTENNLSSVEYGGFMDDKLSDILGVDIAEELPIICIILGK